MIKRLKAEISYSIKRGEKERERDRVTKREGDRDERKKKEI